MHVDALGQVFIRDAQTGDQTVVYAGNSDINQARGVRVTQTNDGNENPAYWTDMQVPLSAVQNTAGIDGDTPIRLFFGTATQSNTINFDTMDNAKTITYDNVLTTSFDSLEGDLEAAGNVGLDTPADGSVVTNSQPTITGTTSPGGGTLRIYVDGALVRTIESVGESWSYQLSSAQALGDGQHRVRAELTRNSQVATTQTNTFTVDTVAPPAITTESLAAWTVEQGGYSQQLAASGGTEPYSWTITAGELPDGLALDESTGVITGTPAQAGNFTFTVEVTDADNTVTTRELAITINAPFTVSETEVAGGMQGVTYSEQITITDGTGPYSYAVVDWELPDALTLDPETGVISGIPTAAGTYSFIVEVTDASGASSIQTFTIEVADRLAIVTAELQSWTVDQAGYSESVDVTGGTGPYSYAITAGTLPDGLVLDRQTGEISGTPMQAGTDKRQAIDEPPTPPTEADPVVVPPESVDPADELDEPVEDIGGIELVEARLETEDVNSVRATSIVVLRNNGTETRDVIVEHRLQSEVFRAQQATLGPGQSVTFRASRTVREPGSYRFSYTWVTEDRDRVLTRTLEADTGAVTIEDETAPGEGSGESEDRCELFGYAFGALWICWYWWVLIAGLLAALASYIVQTQIAGARPLFGASSAGRHLERAGYALSRLVVPFLVGAAFGLAVCTGLYTVGVATLGQFAAVVVVSLAVGAVLGALRLPDIDEGAMAR
ncbi:MAG: hypothetical protein ACI8TL_000201 [Natronomonas sp.]|jgi:hypothetical protein